MKGPIARVLARPVAVLVASVAVLVMGVLSFLNIPLQMLPDGFEERSISVSARLRDSSAAEAERHVAIPLEEALATVSGIASVTSRSDRNEVDIEIELRADADPATVESEARDRIARVEPDLPDDVDRVHVRRQGSNDRPVVFFACTARTDRLTLSDFVEDVLQPRLEALDGVARVGIWGSLRRSVRVQLDQEEITRRRLDLRELLRRLRGDNLSMDLGELPEGGRTSYLRAAMEFGSLEDLRGFPVLEGVRLEDIANVEVIPGLDQGWSRYNGSPVLVGTVLKAAGANTVDICREIRAFFEEQKQTHPELGDLDLIPFFDQGDIIENSIRTLYENALYGGILAVLVLYGFFRRLRMTLLVAAAIPLSLTIAVTVLYLGGSSLNIATLMGLTLAVGMLIDNAIVVVESILRRREEGDDPRTASASGTGEVALAVLTATLTTIVVFVPAIFLSGDTQARLWLASIGGPIAFALLASLAVALVLVPLGSIYLRRTGRTRAAVTPAPGSPLRTHGRYERLLRFALRHRFPVMVLGALLVFSGVVPATRVDRRMAMGRGGGPVRVMLRFPRHYELPDADEVVQRYEDWFSGVRDELGLEGIYARFDERGGMVMLWSRKDSTLAPETVRERVREGWPRVPGVWNSLESAGTMGTTSVRLEGEDAGQLDATMERVEARLRRVPGVAETRRDREAGVQELRVEVDPEAVERGEVSPDLVRGMVGWVLRGAPLRDYRAAGRDLPVLVELDPAQAVEVDDLGALPIPTARGPKPLEALTRTSIRSAAAAIERRDGRRVAEMTVLGGGGDDQQFHQRVQDAVREVELPPGVRFSVTGSWEQLSENFSNLAQAMALGIVLVFLLTGVLFEAVLLPFTVLFAIFPALVGGVWALWVSGKALDELATLGGILLVGVVVNNGIVLIDRAQQKRREGLPLRAAVIAAGRDRVRPVVMTALTTIVGLLPMAVLKGSGDEIPYDSLATAVIGGLVFSTLVTLLLIPVVYTLLVDLGRTGSRLARRIAAGRGRVAPAPAGD